MFEQPIKIPVSTNVQVFLTATLPSYGAKALVLYTRIAPTTKSPPRSAAQIASPGAPANRKGNSRRQQRFHQHQQKHAAGTKCT